MLLDISSLGKAISVSLLNQAINSGTNFLLGIYLVRILSPSDFGCYGIGIAITFLFAGASNALFLTQMIVNTPEKHPEDRPIYITRVFHSLIIFCIIAIVSIGLILIVWMAAYGVQREYQTFVLPITLAAISYVIKDFFIRYSYIVRKEEWALSSNALTALTISVALAILNWKGIHLKAQDMLYIYALGQLSGAIVGLVLAKLHIGVFDLAKTIQEWRSSWTSARWALGGVTVTWLQSQSYMYVTAAILGPAGVAQANAARMMIAPFMFILPAINQVTMPRLATQRAENLSQMKRNGRRYTQLVMCAAFMYFTLVWFLFDIVAAAILGQRYLNIKELVAIWCFILIFQIARDGASTLLQANKQFRILTLMNIVSATLTIACSGAMGFQYGAAGALIGVLIGEAALAALLWFRVGKDVRI